MPPPRKIDLLPAELRDWIREALVARGFSDYEGLADELNGRLAEAGCDLTIQKSAIHQFGSEYQKFIKIQEEAGSWVEGFVKDIGMEDEAKRHSGLFQMLTALAFQTMKAQFEGGSTEPKDLHFLAKMMKDVMSSSGMREKLLADDRVRIREEERQAAAENVEAVAVKMGLTGDRAKELRLALAGVAT